MFVELQDSVMAEVVSGVQLQFNPRLSLRGLSLIVGPYHSGQEHEAHFLQTMGSGSWYRSEFEEFRFGKADHLLQSVWFNLPEENLDSEDLMVAWRSQQPVEGLLRLCSSQEFGPERTDFRWLEPSGELFACVTKTAFIDTKERLRLRIAPDLDLLFAERKLCGWILSQPTLHLVSFWEEPYTTPPDSELPALVQEYLTLVADPYIERMEEGEPEIFQALISLQTRIDVEREAVNQRRVLGDYIKDVIEKFYD